MNATIFDDLFSADTLTASINHVQAVPTLLQGVFEEDGVSTTEVFIERREGALRLVPAAPRGAPATPYSLAKRDGLTFKTAHLPQRSVIYADELQNARAFGSAELYSLTQRRDELLTGMRADLDNTLERHRLGALKGQILDADGSVLLDLLAEFGVTQETHDMELDTDTTHVRTKFIQARRKSEAALGNLRPRSWLCLSSPGFIDSVADHPEVAAAYDRWKDGEHLRNDPRGGFLIGGVEVVEYNFSTDGTPWIADGEAYLVPVGAPKLLLGRYAPADRLDAVNQIGLPYHVSSDELPHGKGLSIEAQSNPVFIATRPRAVVKLTV